MPRYGNDTVEHAATIQKHGLSSSNAKNILSLLTKKIICMGWRKNIHENWLEADKVRWIDVFMVAGGVGNPGRNL